MEFAVKGIIKAHVILGLLFSFCVYADSYKAQAQFDQYHAQQPAADLKYLLGGDQTKLAFREYPSKHTAKAVLIFYHSTGTHSGITYPDFAHTLAQRFPLVVITPDMRGHGFSQGQRGDTPSANTLFDDVNQHIQDARTRFPNTPIFLGGHSSGAGLVMNHSAYEQARPVDGYVFLAPFMGPVAPVFREGVQNDLITIDFKAFAKNANDGSEAHTPAIFYHFPDDMMSRYPEIVSSLTVEMSLATNAQWPYHQLRDIQKPIAMWVGEQDEGLDPSKLAYFITNANAQAYTKILPSQTHISVVTNTAKQVGDWIMGNGLSVSQLTPP